MIHAPAPTKMLTRARCSQRGAGASLRKMPRALRARAHARAHAHAPTLALALALLASRLPPTAAAAPPARTAGDSAAALADNAALIGLLADPWALRVPPGPEPEATLGGAGAAVRRSGVDTAGRGAFARRGFATGETVGEYYCRVFPHGGAVSHGDRARTWRINSTHSCDGAAFPLRNPMLYVNSVAQLHTCGQYYT